MLSVVTFPVLLRLLMAQTEIFQGAPLIPGGGLVVGVLLYAFRIGVRRSTSTSSSPLGVKAWEWAWLSAGRSWLPTAVASGLSRLANLVHYSISNCRWWKRHDRETTQL